MATVRQEINRKLDLVDNYRAQSLEAVLDELRDQAAQEAENDRFAWKGEFRSREEILELYNKGRKYDRRFMLDTLVLTLILFFAVIIGRNLARLFMPVENFPAARQEAQN